MLVLTNVDFSKYLIIEQMCLVVPEILLQCEYSFGPFGSENVISSFVVLY